MLRIEADYLTETAHPIEDAAAAMEGEQSSGTFVPVPGETPELKQRYAARVEALEEIEEVGAPSFPGAGLADQVHRRACVTFSWPLENIGPSLPNLLATVAGNLFELKHFSVLRVIDIRLPPAFGDASAGPGFGIAGSRRLAGVTDRPLIGTIIKPSVGFTSEVSAELTSQLVEAGIDFVKDDELQSDGAGCPFEDRVRTVMTVINRHADRTGKR